MDSAYQFLSVVAAFVRELFGLTVPVLGCTYLALFIGLWALTGVGHWIFNVILGWDDWKDSL